MPNYADYKKYSCYIILCDVNANNQKDNNLIKLYKDNKDSS